MIDSPSWHTYHVRQDWRAIMKRDAIVATTHIDAHNMRITPGALKNAAKDINDGRKPSMGMEHDPSLPPIGKSLSARVEKLEDGALALVCTQELFEARTKVELPSGSIGIKQECESNRDPFVLGDIQVPDVATIQSGRVNFQSRTEQQEFLAEVKRESQINFGEKELIQKSVIPDPQCIITLGLALSAAWYSAPVAKKIAETIGDIASDELRNLYSFIRATVVRFSSYALPRNRPRTYVVVIPGTPIIELLARSNDANLVIRALLRTPRRELMKQAKDLYETYRAERIQFMLSENGDWEFNYLLTSNGATIGTETCFRRRDEIEHALVQRILEREAEGQ